MTIDERILAFQALSVALEDTLQGKGNEKLIRQTANEHTFNTWFIPDFVREAVSAIAKMLAGNHLHQWIFPYRHDLENRERLQRIGVIMAGNIPLAGFHDFLSVLISGNIFVGKLSSNDAHLLPIVGEMLCETEPRFSDRIVFCSEKLTAVDKVIASGDNNSARYFSYYFQKYPSIIRKHCNSAAVLNGKESKEELQKLADDIFLYFGLGCRSVSKIYIPHRYDFTNLFQALDTYREIVGQHHKYLNNLEYQKTVHLLNMIPFLDQGLTIFKENNSLASPVGVIHYQYYDDIYAVEKEILSLGEELQCCVSNALKNASFFPLGQSQYPQLNNYANQTDTIAFLFKEQATK
ncbi:MAG: hypothetical protein LBH82_04035 [Bacteroidales bacterium]|nr:hypothetical protein [Bacteroidales bacterium]